MSGFFVHRPRFPLFWARIFFVHNNFRGHTTWLTISWLSSSGSSHLLTLSIINRHGWLNVACLYVQQECIPVGCVPSAAVAVCWGRGVSAWGGGVCLVGCLPRGVSAWRGVSGGGVCPEGVSGRHPYCGQNSWHTLVKTLPFHNFICGR